MGQWYKITVSKCQANTKIIFVLTFVLGVGSTAYCLGLGCEQLTRLECSAQQSLWYSYCHCKIFGSFLRVDVYHCCGTVTQS